MKYVWVWSWLFHHPLIGERGAKYFLHLFKVLQGSWAYLWSNWIHDCYWCLVCWLCSGRATSWTCNAPFLFVFISCIAFFSLFNVHWDSMYLIRFFFSGYAQPLFPGESALDQLVEIIKVNIVIVKFFHSSMRFFYSNQWMLSFQGRIRTCFCLCCEFFTLKMRCLFADFGHSYQGGNQVHES